VLTYNNNSDLPLVIGVDLGGTQIRTALLQGSRLLARVGELTGENPTPERIIPRIYETINQVIFEAHVTLDQIAGIGVGAPGPLNSRDGVVFAPPNLQGWTNVPLRDIMQSHFNKPTYIENDANAAALAEHMFGAGRGSQEMVYMTISTGIGGGIISNGQIMEGIFGTAGEIGHMTIDWHGERCNCGNIGCLESIASGTAIARRANQMIALGKGSDLLEFALQNQQKQSGDPVLDKPRMQDTAIRITAHTVALAAEAGIPAASEIIAQAAEGLGVGLVNVVHLFNPELIILGGSVTKIGPRLLDPALHILQKRGMRVPRDSVRIVLAELGEDVGLVGAGALIYYNKGREVKTQEEQIYREEQTA
jgi:glucokinase